MLSFSQELLCKWHLCLLLHVPGLCSIFVFSFHNNNFIKSCGNITWSLVLEICRNFVFLEFKASGELLIFFTKYFMFKPRDIAHSQSFHALSKLLWMQMFRSVIDATASLVSHMDLHLLIPLDALSFLRSQHQFVGGPRFCYSFLTQSVSQSVSPKHIFI